MMLQIGAHVLELHHCLVSPRECDWRVLVAHGAHTANISTRRPLPQPQHTNAKRIT